jgi:hypothetical protein
MKKMDMVKTIQVKEAVLFLLTKQAELVFGNGSDSHKRARASWHSVMELMGELGIESDYSLPAHTESHKIIIDMLNTEDIAV